MSLADALTSCSGHPMCIALLSQGVHSVKYFVAISVFILPQEHMSQVPGQKSVSVASRAIHVSGVRVTPYPRATSAVCRAFIDVSASRCSRGGAMHCRLARCVCCQWSTGKSNGLFHRRWAPTLAPTLRHRKPPPSRSPVRKAREAAGQAARRPLRVAGSGRAAKTGSNV